MVATATITVEAEVVSVARETVLPSNGLDVDDLKFTRRLSTLRVLNTFSGSAPNTVVVAEEGWDSNNRRVIYDGWPGLEVGNRVIMFLKQWPNEPFYIALKSSAQALIESDSAAVRMGEATDPAAKKLKLLKPKQMREAIIAAKAVVERDQIKPLQIGENMGASAEPRNDPSTPPPNVDNPGPKVVNPSSKK